MRWSHVLLAVLVIGCGGGGGGDGDPTSPGGNGPGTGPGMGPGTGPGTGPASASATVTTNQSDDGYGSAVFSFSPSAVTIRVGGTVTWSNETGSVAHNVTFTSTPGAPANVANFASGNANRTFASSGTFSYHCTNHQGMTGQVTVQ